ncbi:Zinc finger, RING-type [Corchorus capsularis]|uniref:RING-type E3 ubiquitin transferase n=1 Tax=Corchorus capsularis TaxID=210143 RepID=A0A1R3GJ38_COCAP|nr:Zinc finger, RING-type [Corchorus capsularis]
MGDRMVGRYWCYMCSQTVNPTIEPEIKCPFCETGFLEEVTTIRNYTTNNNGIDLGSLSSFSLWAPILLGLIGGLGSSQLRITGSREQQEQQQTNNNDNNNNNLQDNTLDDELGRELESLLRRRRSSASALRMLQDMRNAVASETDNSENGRERGGRMILFDPFNDEALIVQGSFGLNQGPNPIPSHRATSSFGDYLMGPGWDLLLQYLAENDTNRYGTPPAKKEAVEAMPTVIVEENVQCSICLEDIEIGSEAKEMPCKHYFHSGCIVPWLELHSSCPVCRYQLPADESKIEANNNVSRNSEGTRVGTSSDVQNGSRLGTGRRFWIPIPWPYDGLLSLPGPPQIGSTSSPSSSSDRPGSENSAPTRPESENEAVTDDT